jgi:hypothetical protein
MKRSLACDGGGRSLAFLWKPDVSSIRVRVRAKLSDEGVSSLATGEIRWGLDDAIRLFALGRGLLLTVPLWRETMIDGLAQGFWMCK